MCRHVRGFRNGEGSVTVWRCGFSERGIGARPDAAAAPGGHAIRMVVSVVERASPPWAGPPRGQRVVVVDDEASITDPLRAALVREGFRVKVAATGADGLALIREDAPDVVLLDLMLPDMDGRDLCRELRVESDVPVIMLTARGLETDRVVGLELGADDYLVKPFSVAELSARIRAVLRRTGSRAIASGDAIALGGLRIDRARHEVTLDGRMLELPPREYDLLVALAANAGRVVKREKLMDLVWGEDWFGTTKTLDVHLATLRGHLGDDANDPRFVHTVRGVGLRFATDAELRGA
jgi:two-component system response regulator RegX3